MFETTMVNHINKNPRQEFKIKVEGFNKNLCTPSYHVYMINKNDSLVFYVKQYQHYNQNMFLDIEKIEKGISSDQLFKKAIGIYKISNEPVIVFADSSFTKKFASSSFSSSIPDSLKFNDNNCHLRSEIFKYGKFKEDEKFELLGNLGSVSKW